MLRSAVRSRLHAISPAAALTESLEWKLVAQGRAEAARSEPHHSHASARRLNRSAGAKTRGSCPALPTAGSMATSLAIGRARCGSCGCSLGIIAAALSSCEARPSPNSVQQEAVLMAAASRAGTGA